MAALYYINNIITFLTMLICADYFGISMKERSKKRLILSFCVFIAVLSAGAYLYFAVGLGNGISSAAYAVIFLAQFLASLAIICGRISLKLIYVIAVIELLTELISSSLDILLSEFLPGIPVSGLAARCALLAALCLFCRKSDRLHTAAALKLIPRHIFVLIVLVFLCLSALTTLNAFRTDEAFYQLKSGIINGLIIILTALVTIIILSLLINVIAKQQSENRTRLLKEQTESQIRHYDRLEQLNSEMSKFRHDYSNHLRSILSLIRMKEYADAEEYITNLQKIKYRSRNMYYTGNKLADAILSDKAYSLPDNIRIEYQGVIPPEIENTDLCVILSNSLDNAEEACLKCAGESVISVNADVKRGYFLLTVTNPTIRADEFTSIPQTTKTDSQNHGMGLMNIEETVKKYGGQMKINCRGGIFEITMIMKING